MMHCNCFAIGDKQIQKLIGEMFQKIITDIPAAKHEIVKILLLTNRDNRTKKGMCPQCDCLNKINAAVLVGIEKHNAKFQLREAA